MKSNKIQLLFSSSDFEKLNALVAISRTDVAAMLEEELARANVISDEKLPSDVVAMDTLVKFRDLDTQKETEIQIVYPHEVDAANGKISVLAPMGAALVGLRVGQSIEWPVPGGRHWPAPPASPEPGR